MRKWLRAMVLLGVWLALPYQAIAQQPSINPDLMTACTKAITYDASTSGATKLVTGTSTAQIYVCGWNILAAGTVNVSLEYGTGGTCGSGTHAVTPAWQLIAQTQNVDHLPVYTGITPVPVSNDLCINTSAGVAVQAVVYYAQF